MQRLEVRHAGKALSCARNLPASRQTGPASARHVSGGRVSLVAGRGAGGACEVCTLKMRSTALQLVRSSWHETVRWAHLKHMWAMRVCTCGGVATMGGMHTMAGLPPWGACTRHASARLGFYGHSLWASLGTTLGLHQALPLGFYGTPSGLLWALLLGFYGHSPCGLWCTQIS